MLAIGHCAYENLKSRAYFAELRIGEPLTGGRAAVHPQRLVNGKRKLLSIRSVG
jgi:hypothetical protein